MLFSSMCKTTPLTLGMGETDVKPFIELPGKLDKAFSAPVGAGELPFVDFQAVSRLGVG